MRADIVPGAKFPDYELTDHTRQRRKLSELQGNDPMILVLSRGHYCPKDHQQHLELARVLSARSVSAYTQIVTISTDNILETNEFRDAVGAQWTFLSDSGRKIQKDLDIQEYTDPHHNPMIPHTLVSSRAWYLQDLQWLLVLGPPLGKRPLARPARSLTQDPPDWDLGAPGLRENWDEGDKKQHWPYGAPHPF